MNMNEVPVLTVDEAAEYLRISKSSLFKLAQEGKAPLRFQCKGVRVPEKFNPCGIGKGVASKRGDNQEGAPCSQRRM